LALEEDLHLQVKQVLIDREGLVETPIRCALPQQAMSPIDDGFEHGPTPNMALAILE
jgi:hypothetical protein